MVLFIEFKVLTVVIEETGVCGPGPPALRAPLKSNKANLD